MINIPSNSIIEFLHIKSIALKSILLLIHNFDIPAITLPWSGCNISPNHCQLSICINCQYLILSPLVIPQLVLDSILIHLISLPEWSEWSLWEWWYLCLRSISVGVQHETEFLVLESNPILLCHGWVHQYVFTEDESNGADEEAFCSLHSDKGSFSDRSGGSFDSGGRVFVFASLRSPLFAVGGCEAPLVQSVVWVGDGHWINEFVDFQSDCLLSGVIGGTNDFGCFWITSDLDCVDSLVAGPKVDGLDGSGYVELEVFASISSQLGCGWFSGVEDSLLVGDLVDVGYGGFVGWSEVVVEPSG